ncbi:bromodomain-containing protein 8 [Pelomyxa schiedti]|nr:bromodomain-containing protein 8 [Pelomyxa schiedti]
MQQQHVSRTADENKGSLTGSKDEGYMSFRAISPRGWTIPERLLLSHVVQKVGDVNWKAVAKMMTESSPQNVSPDDPKRDKLFFTSKNCASEYYQMMEEVDNEKTRKMSGRRPKQSPQKPSRGPESNIPGLVADHIRKVRIQQLKQSILQKDKAILQLEQEIADVESGKCDSILDKMYEELCKEHVTSAAAAAAVASATSFQEVEGDQTATPAVGISNTPSPVPPPLSPSVSSPSPPAMSTPSSPHGLSERREKKEKALVEQLFDVESPLPVNLKKPNKSDGQSDTSEGKPTPTIVELPSEILAPEKEREHIVDSSEDNATRKRKRIEDEKTANGGTLQEPPPQQPSPEKRSRSSLGNDSAQKQQANPPIIPQSPTEHKVDIPVSTLPVTESDALSKVQNVLSDKQTLLQVANIPVEPHCQSVPLTHITQPELQPQQPEPEPQPQPQPQPEPEPQPKHQPQPPTPQVSLERSETVTSCQKSDVSNPKELDTEPPGSPKSDRPLLPVADNTDSNVIAEINSSMECDPLTSHQPVIPQEQVPEKEEHHHKEVAKEIVSTETLTMVDDTSKDQKLIANDPVLSQDSQPCVSSSSEIKTSGTTKPEEAITHPVQSAQLEAQQPSTKTASHPLPKEQEASQKLSANDKIPSKNTVQKTKPGDPSKVPNQTTVHSSIKPQIITTKPPIKHPVKQPESAHSTKIHDSLSKLHDNPERAKPHESHIDRLQNPHATKPLDKFAPTKPQDKSVPTKAPDKSTLTKPQEKPVVMKPQDKSAPTKPHDILSVPKAHINAVSTKPHDNTVPNAHHPTVGKLHDNAASTKSHDTVPPAKPHVAPSEKVRGTTAPRVHDGTTSKPSSSVPVRPHDKSSTNKSQENLAAPKLHSTPVKHTDSSVTKSLPAEPSSKPESESGSRLKDAPLNTHQEDLNKALPKSLQESNQKHTEAAVKTKSSTEQPSITTRQPSQQKPVKQLTLEATAPQPNTKSTQANKKLTPTNAHPQSVPLHTATKLTPQMQGSLFQIWKSISKQPEAFWFREPVGDEASDYDEIIKERIDLRTIRLRLLSGKIQSPVEFYRLFMLMFANAFVFNHEHTEIFMQTANLKKYFLDALHRSSVWSVIEESITGKTETQKPTKKTDTEDSRPKNQTSTTASKIESCVKKPSDPSHALGQHNIPPSKAASQSRLTGQKPLQPPKSLPQEKPNAQSTSQHALPHKQEKETSSTTSTAKGVHELSSGLLVTHTNTLEKYFPVNETGPQKGSITQSAPEVPTKLPPEALSTPAQQPQLTTSTTDLPEADTEQTIPPPQAPRLPHAPHSSRRRRPISSVPAVAPVPATTSNPTHTTTAPEPSKPTTTSAATTTTPPETTENPHQEQSQQPQLQSQPEPQPPTQLPDNTNPVPEAAATTTDPTMTLTITTGGDSATPPAPKKSRLQQQDGQSQDG